MKKIIYVAIAAVILINLGFIKNPFAGEPEFVKSYENSVVLYATAWCGYCKKTRELLDKNNIDYIEYDIEKSTKGKDEYDKLSGRGIPLMVINGNVVRGYNPKSILELAKNI